MKNWLLVSFLCIVSQFAVAQIAMVQDQSGDIQIPAVNIYTTDKSFATEEDVTKFLEQEHDILSLPGYATTLISSTKSLTGKHFTYSIKKNGYPIHNAQIRIHTDLVGNVLFMQDNVPFIDNIFSENQNKTKKVIVLSNGIWALAGFEKLHDAFDSERIIVDGEVQGLITQKLFYTAPDTQVKAQVFLVNPLNTAEKSYGSPYIDSSDLDVPQLNAERKWVDMTAEYENDTFWLKSDRYYFGNVSNPITPQTFSLTDTFSFTRSQYQFEDVNAFYHITNMSNHVEQLGFSNALPDTLVIDAHGYNGSDFSSFNYGVSPVELEFGEGGVDDAEDGEIVVHEFSHALAFVAGGDSYANTRDRSAMEEGNADYFSASYSKSYTDFAWKKMFNWDGHNPFFEGVTIGAKLQYPQDMTGNSNADREIWSTPLMCIYDKIGRASCDSLVLEHLFYQYKTATIPDMANILLTVDSLLFNKRYHQDIRSCFSMHNILLSEGKKLEFNQLFNAYNTDGFSTGMEDASILSKSGQRFGYTISNDIGQVISQESNVLQLNVPTQEFKSGIYFVELKLDGFTSFLKIIKY